MRSAVHVHLYEHREVKITRGPFREEDFWVYVVKDYTHPAPSGNGVFVQMHGVRPDDKGYVNSGETQFIAFQKKDEYIIVLRRSMEVLLHRNVKHVHVANPSQAELVLFRDNILNEVLTWVPISLMETWVSETDHVQLVIVDRWPREHVVTLPVPKTTFPVLNQ